MTETLEEIHEKPKRGGFLTTLLVLTFIGSGYTLALNFSSLISGERTEQEMKEMTVDLVDMLEETLSEAELEDQVYALEFTNEHHFSITISNSIASFLSILGAIMMWKLSKLGFHIYSIGQIVSMLSVFLIYTEDLYIFSFTKIFVVAFALIFITLYALNWKRLR